MLADLPVEVRSISQFGPLPEPIEDGLDLVIGHLLPHEPKANPRFWIGC